MPRTVFVNGQYLPEDQATVSIFDRGFLMADGVYEVTTILDGKLIDFDGHVARLARSLRELNMPEPMDAAGLLEMHRTLAWENQIDEGLVYMQVTRGNAGDRDFVYPDPATTAPTLVAFTQSKPGLGAGGAMAQKGWRVITVEDQRWARRDIKTVQLLYPSMAKMAAKAAGCDDAWMVEDGFITEGSSNNAWIIKDGRLITRALSHDILHGITRAAVMRLAGEVQLEVEERNFTPDEVKAADEAFVTSATSFVQPIVEIDGVKIGTGAPGAVARRMREIYVEEMRKTAI